MSSQSLKAAINELGRFFGIRSADAYLQAIIAAEADIPMAIDPLKEAELPLRGKLLNEISGQGDAAPSLQWLLTYMETEIGEDSALLEEIKTDICITPSSPTVPQTLDPAKYPVNAPSVSLKDGQDETQGLFLPESGDYYTIADFRGLDETTTTTSEISADDPQTPVHVIQVFPAVGNVSQSDTDVVAMFMNNVPALELSRAVPYIDILVVTRNASSDPASGKTRPLSLGRWMLGQDMSEEDEAVRGIFTSEDISLTPDPTKDDAFRTSATMEIFTSPQTMVPINRDGSARVYNENAGTGGITPRDPFRPMLSLQDLTIDVSPSSGMHTYKTAAMKVILHDKAMLGAVTPLVAPQERGSVNLILTYGWAHPDGSTNPVRAADADSSRWGDLINSMRVTETYGVVNSDFSFADDGSVDINMKLAMVGAASIDNFQITLPKVTEQAGEVNEIFSQIKSALSTYIKSEREFGKVNVPSTLRSATNLGQANNMSKKDIKALKKWLAARKANPELTEIHSYVQKIFGKGKNETESGELQDLKQTKGVLLSQMLERLKVTPDPFLRQMPDGVQFSGKGVCSVGAKSKKGKNISRSGTFEEAHKLKISASKHSVKMKKVIGGGTVEKDAFNSRQTFVSVGKLLSFFVGESLGTCGDYKEIQLIFYNFNDSSSYLFDYNIAQFPILLSDFSQLLTEKFNINGRMSLTQFMSFLNRYFLRDQGAPGYGFSAIYGDRKEGKKRASRQLNSTYKETGTDGKPKQSVINSKKKLILAKAYGLEPSESSVTFKLPQIMMSVETAPMRDVNEDGAADYVTGTTDTILRLHIMDQKSSTTSTLLDVFNSFAGSGVMSGIKRQPTLPSLRGSRHAEVIANQIKLLMSPDLNVIEPITVPTPPPEGYDTQMTDKITKGMYFVNISDPSRLKNILMQMAPTLIHGALNTSIITAKVASLNNPALMSVNMLRQQKKGTGAEEGTDSGLPQQIVPTSLDLEVLGCPFLNFGQEYFVDLGSNSTADNFYAVVGVTHSLSAGNFTTSVKMINRMAFGKWSSTLDQVKELANLAIKVENEAQADTD